MTTVPTPATEPDPVRDDTWDPDEFPATIAGIVDKRETFERKRDGEPFDVLSINDGDSVQRVLTGRAHLKQLLAEHDPQPGDGIAITAFGREPGGQRFRYAMRVDKGGRLAAA